MTVKEYLHQAYRLDQRIKSDTMEAQNLREMAGSVSAIQYDKDRVQTSRNTEAPFVRTLEKLWTLEKKIAGELEMLSDLKKQIREVIEAVPDTDERMVLKYRFNVREIKTSRDIADWNAGKIPVAVIHPASAGHGLNLQAGGSTLVWFGLTWSLELYQQTNARLWRQGQESGTVVIQHIITKRTIDERIVKALSKKEMTQTALIDAVKADLEVV